MTSTDCGLLTWLLAPHLKGEELSSSILQMLEIELFVLLLSGLYVNRLLLPDMMSDEVKESND